MKYVSQLSSILTKCKYRDFKNNIFWNQYLKVATWSPLVSAFNSTIIKDKRLGFDFFGEKTGLFGFNELQDPKGFYLLKENAVCRSDLLVREALNPNRLRKMVVIFDELSDTLCKVADLAEFIRLGHPQTEFAHAARETSTDISSLVEKLNTNRLLYEKLYDVVNKGDKFLTDQIDEYVAELFLFDFEQCGIHLNESDREKVVAYNDYILHVGSYFMSRTLSPRSVKKSKLPERIQNCFIDDNEKIHVTGLSSDAEDEQVREAAYKIYLYPDKHQEQLLDELLSARHKLAVLCGFPSYAHRAIKGSIAGDPDFVHQFLDLLSEKVKPFANSEYEEMLNEKKEDTKHGAHLMPWDVPYYILKCKQKKFNVQVSDYCPYFSLGACMDGLCNIFHSLYNVKLEVQEPKNGELWHEDVKKIAVYEQDVPLGYIYCDFYERPEKPNQDCHFTIQGGCLLSDETYQKPVVVLMLNLPNPTWSRPSLLTPSMVDNLFHEMGHAMHSMLARTRYQHVTGTRCSTDLAEVPSVLMEYFSSDPRVLSSFARHYKTGEAIPQCLLEKLSFSKGLFSGCETQLQILYAAYDQACHSKHPLGCTTTELLTEIQNNYYGIPYVPNTAWQLRFGHLVGYGAKYYSYLMSRAVASWIWHKFFKSDPFSREKGQKYRNEVLSYGGSKLPKILIKDFLQSDITPETLSEALLVDITYKNKL